MGSSRIDRIVRELRRECSRDYCIRYIDLEKCIYRDFGDGHDVEISGLSGSRRKEYEATIYLWKDGRRCIKKVRHVPPTAGAIHSVVEDLRDMVIFGLV